MLAAFFILAFKGGRGEQNNPWAEVTSLINEAESFAEIVQKERKIRKTGQNRKGLGSVVRPINLDPHSPPG